MPETATVSGQPSPTIPPYFHTSTHPYIPSLPDNAPLRRPDRRPAPNHIDAHHHPVEAGAATCEDSGHNPSPVPSPVKDIEDHPEEHAEDNNVENQPGSHLRSPGQCKKIRWFAAAPLGSFLENLLEHGNDLSHLVDPP